MWKVNESDDRRLDTFLLKYLRRMLKVKWRYDILNKTKLKIISIEVKIGRSKWIGCILRKKEDSHCLLDHFDVDIGRERESGSPKNKLIEKRRKRMTRYEVHGKHGLKRNR